VEYLKQTLRQPTATTLLINPNTNKPYTSNLDVINNDWGMDAVEFNKDYVDGVLHGTEKSYYQSGSIRSIGHFKRGVLVSYTMSYAHLS
jgi:antitoxin component YwqK of YwqJK toxin-antitoxin module